MQHFIAAALDLMACLCVVGTKDCKKPLNLKVGVMKRIISSLYLDSVEQM